MAFEPINVTPFTTTPSPATAPEPNVSPPHRHKTWHEAAGQRETAAPLHRLPEGLIFPEQFPEPITYDPVGKRLVYRGFMSQASYTYLSRLSRDPGYITALDQLYIGSAHSNTRASWAARRGWRLLVAGLAAGLALLGGWWYWH